MTNRYRLCVSFYLLLLLTAHAASCNCTKGIKSAANSLCYLFSSPLVSISAAHDFCQSQGMEMATMEEEALMRGYLEMIEQCEDFLNMHACLVPYDEETILKRTYWS